MCDVGDGVHGSGDDARADGVDPRRVEEREAEEFFVDYDRIASDAAAMLRLEAGRNPHDKALIELVGERSTRSELFRRR